MIDMGDLSENDESYRPDWADEAKENPNKPNWVDAIPHSLWSLGQVFFPIPSRRKGWNYPHHLDSHRYKADSEVLNAWLESGAGYGIACAGDLTVVDVDHLGILDDIQDNLPDTLHQKTGSREGYHFFYKCAGADSRINLDVPLDASSHIAAEGIDLESEVYKRHVGEVRCNKHEYVVGPGSVHPSGNSYGPLEGDSIAIITEEELIESVGHLDTSKGELDTKADVDRSHSSAMFGDIKSTTHVFYDLTADDVMPYLEPENRISHPVHGSSTGSNFMKNKDRETFVCWRCQIGMGGGCAINPQQMLALLEVGNRYGDYACETLRREWGNDLTLHYHAWKRAVKEGVIPFGDAPYKVLKGYLIQEGRLEEGEEIHDTHSVSEELKYVMQTELH